MMKMDFDAAIFDMDGTLLDTMPYWRYTTLEYILAHGLPVYPDMVSVMLHTSSRKLILENRERLGIEVGLDVLVPELERFMNRHYLYDARLKDPSLPAYLDLLASRGVRLCVATGSPRQFARNGLRRVGILDRFEFVTDNYEYRYAKDNPDYFRDLSARLDVKPARCCVFEDALYAMQSAKAAGMQVCAIEEETQRSDREMILETADTFIHSYTELM